MPDRLCVAVIIVQYPVVAAMYDTAYLTVCVAGIVVRYPVLAAMYDTAYLTVCVLQVLLYDIRSSRPLVMNV